MSNEKEREEEKDITPGEGESSPEEEEFDKRLQYAYTAIRRELPGIETEEDEFEAAIHLWIPYREITYDNNDEEDLVDRALHIGTVFLLREDPQTHEHFLKTEQEIDENIRDVKHDFLFKEEQICSIVNQLLQKKEEEDE